MPSARLLLLACGVLLSACTVTSSQRLPLPERDAPVPPGMARVYIAREGKLVGSLRGVRIFDEQREVGVLTEGGYLCWERPAEPGVGRAVFEGYKLDGGPVESVFDLPREGGGSAWFRVILQRGDRKPRVESIPEADGRALIESRARPRQG